MAHPGNLATGIVTLLLISSSGCAGNGLRNMFSSNETAGYKTLEELEAEEAAAAERNAAIADAGSEGPRFAPWLPFGKTSSESADAVASSEADLPDSEVETTASAWWKNPFRNRDDVAGDPFLTQEEPGKAAVAQNRKTAERTTLPVAADRKTEFSSVEEPIRTVSSGGRETKAVTGEEDEMLVEKFESQFRKNTVETADAAEKAEPLIVAGKTAAKYSAETESAAGEKLLELERLLAERRTTARNSATKISSPSDLSADLNQASDEIFEKFRGLRPATHQQAGIRRNQVSQAVDSFDSFLAESIPAAISPKQPLGSGDRTRFESHGNQASTDVDVANADWVFGIKAAQPASSDTQTSPPGMLSAGWFGTTVSNELQETPGKDNSPANTSERERRALKSAAGRFTSGPAALRTGENSRPVALSDASETDFPFAESSLVQPAGKSSTHDLNVARKISAGRELPNTPNSAGSANDSFFTDMPSGDATSGFAAAVPANVEPAEYQDSSGKRGFLRSVKGRHWLLLLGGAIVVLLLFAPGRKKPLQANHA